MKGLGCKLAARHKEGAILIAGDTRLNRLRNNIPPRERSKNVMGFGVAMTCLLASQVLQLQSFALVRAWIPRTALSSRFLPGVAVLAGLLAWGGYAAFS